MLHKAAKPYRVKLLLHANASKENLTKVFDLDLNSMCFMYRYANPADMRVPLWHIGLAYKHILLLLISTY